MIIHHEPRLDGTRQMPETGILIPAHASALGKAQLGLPARRGQARTRHSASQHDG
jgi:hypothetical protein